MQKYNSLYFFYLVMVIIFKVLEKILREFLACLCQLLCTRCCEIRSRTQLKRWKREKRCDNRCVLIRFIDSSYLQLTLWVSIVWHNVPHFFTKLSSSSPPSIFHRVFFTINEKLSSLPEIGRLSRYIPTNPSVRYSTAL